jgi:quercetin dioxygenase-like cupin family protein
MPEEAMNAQPGNAGALPPAEAAGLDGIVAYFDGSIVSRALLKTPAGSVTAFAFDAGQTLSEHTAPFDALVQVLEGEAGLTVGGKAVRAKAGQLVLLPANVPHALKATTRFKMLLTMIRG